MMPFDFLFFRQVGEYLLSVESHDPFTWIEVSMKSQGGEAIPKVESASARSNILSFRPKGEILPRSFAFLREAGCVFRGLARVNSQSAAFSDCGRPFVDSNRCTKDSDIF